MDENENKGLEYEISVEAKEATASLDEILKRLEKLSSTLESIHTVITNAFENNTLKNFSSTIKKNIDSVNNTQFKEKELKVKTKIDYDAIHARSKNYIVESGSLGGENLDEYGRDVGLLKEARGESGKATNFGRDLNSQIVQNEIAIITLIEKYKELYKTIDNPRSTRANLGNKFGELDDIIHKMLILNGAYEKLTGKKYVNPFGANLDAMISKGTNDKNKFDAVELGRLDTKLVGIIQKMERIKVTKLNKAQFDYLVRKAYELKNAINNIPASGKNSGYFNEMYERMDRIVKKSSSTSIAFGEISSAANVINNKLNSMFKNITKSHRGAKSLGDAFSNLGKKIENIGKKFTRFTKMFTLMVMRQVIRDIIRQIKEASVEMAKLSTSYNTAMSGMKTSLNGIRNAFTSAFAPLAELAANIVIPALNAIASKINDIGKIIAAISGKTTYAKLTSSAYDYASASASAAKSQKQLISGLSELNILSDNKDSSQQSYSLDVQPIESKFQTAASKIRTVLDKILEPFKKTWEKMGGSVVASWKKSFGSFGTLLGSIFGSWETMMNEDGTNTIFGSVLSLSESVANCIGTIIDKTNEWWNTNDNGISLMRGIKDVFVSVIGFIEKIVDSVNDFAASHDMEPILGSISGIIQNISPIIDHIGDVVATLLEKVALPALAIILPIVEKVSDLLADNPWIIEGIIGGILALKGVVAGIGFVNKIGEVIEFLKVLGTAVSSVLGPAGIVVAGVGIGIGAISLLSKAFGNALGTDGSITKTFAAAWEEWSYFFDNLGSKIADTAQKVWDFFGGIGSTISDAFTGLFGDNNKSSAYSVNKPNVKTTNMTSAYNKVAYASNQMTASKENNKATSDNNVEKILAAINNKDMNTYLDGNKITSNVNKHNIAMAKVTGKPQTAY